jgi:hypothetical protein
MAALTEIRHCEVCGTQNLRTVLDLGSHPMCDDLVAIGDTRRCREYPIEILFCDTCLTAHQRFQIPKSELFPPSYHYRSRHTADVLNGMRQLVAAYQQAFGGLVDKKVVDVGCNDGSLLSIFREAGAITYGIEPTSAAADAQASGHDVTNDFLSEAVASAFVAVHGKADVISFTNVFAHIEDLGSVIRSLKLLAGPDTVIVIENHYLGAILEKNQFDTFYHEHPRTYTGRSFWFIAEALGMRIARAEFPQRYGGNIRVFLAARGAADAEPEGWQALRDREAGYGEGLARLSAQIEKWRIAKRAALETEFDRFGTLEAKAFPGRAAIPIKVLGLDESRINAVYEKPGSGKIGHYVPGTRIPIRSDDDFVPAAGDRPLLNLAWHISGEITGYMRERGYQGRIIDIISSEDFTSP